MTHHWRDGQYVTARALNAYLPRAIMRHVDQEWDGEAGTSTPILDSTLHADLRPGLWSVRFHIVIQRRFADDEGMRTRWVYPPSVDPATRRSVRGPTPHQNNPSATPMRLSAPTLATQVRYATGTSPTHVWPTATESAVVDMPEGGRVGLAWGPAAAHTRSAISAGSYMLAEPIDLY